MATLGTLKQGEKKEDDSEDRYNATKLDGWLRMGEFHSRDKYREIPFSESAVDTLTFAQEKIRAVSEMLYNFIEQDETKILETLTNQKLLSL